MIQEPDKKKKDRSEQALFSPAWFKEKLLPYWGSEEDEEKRKKKKPARNANTNEIFEVLSGFISYARKQRIRFIYPGTIVNGGRIASLAGLLVTEQEVIGIQVFGYGGNLRPGKGERDWIQELNGEEKVIPNPLRQSREQYQIVRGAMDAAGLAGVPLRVVSLFTSRDAHLPSGSGAYGREDFMAELRARAVSPVTLDIGETARILVGLTKRFEKKKKGLLPPK